VTWGFNWVDLCSSRDGIDAPSLASKSASLKGGKVSQRSEG